ncbi:6543_t:CDS:10 [Ambispora leptoticha]|uniref:Transcription factor BYE1 n=1 Tax=Ambispora leptoticha TaxID=144679 RepID=A0A9N8YP29_9GLOM|nr:6543_t:CDS:10 [Ambispora leptoticha]
MENSELSNYINIGDMVEGDEVELQENQHQQQGAGTGGTQTLPISFINPNMAIDNDGNSIPVNSGVENNYVGLNFFGDVDAFSDASTLATRQVSKEPTKSVLINPEVANSQFLIDPALTAENGVAPLQSQLLISGPNSNNTSNSSQQQLVQHNSHNIDNDTSAGHQYGTRFANKRTTFFSPHTQQPLYQHQLNEEMASHLKADVTNSKRKSAQKKDEKVYCICRKPDDHRVMIQCDSCKEWFHIACVNLSKAEAEVIEKYFCPTCDEIRSGGGVGVGGRQSKNLELQISPYENSDTAAEDGQMPLVVVGKKAKSIDPKALIMYDEKEKVVMKSKKAMKQCMFPDCHNPAREIDGYCSDECAVKDADNVLLRLATSGNIINNNRDLDAAIPKLRKENKNSNNNITTTSNTNKNNSSGGRSSTYYSINDKLHRKNSSNNNSKEKSATSAPSSSTMSATTTSSSAPAVIHNSSSPEKTRLILKSPTPIRPAAAKPSLSLKISAKLSRTSSSNANDRIRATSVKNFSEIFTQMFNDLYEKGELPREEKHDDDTSKEQEPPEVQAEKLAVRIEKAMFDQFATKVKGVPAQCEQPYKSKLRSLLTNLKDKKNDLLRMRIIKGEIPPEKLVLMSSEDLANPELKSLAEQVRRESIHKSVLLAAADEPRIKKTHKGDIMIISRSSSPSIEQRNEEDNVGATSTRGKGHDVTRNIISPTTASSISGSSNTITTSPTSLGAVSSASASKSDSSLDDLLARISSNAATRRTSVELLSRQNEKQTDDSKSSTDASSSTNVVIDFETFNAQSAANKKDGYDAWDPSSNDDIIMGDKNTTNEGDGDNDEMLIDNFALTNSPTALSPNSKNGASTPMDLSSPIGSDTPPYVPSPTLLPASLTKPAITNSDRSTTSISTNVTQEKKLSKDPVWNGKIIYQGVAKFSAKATQIAARTLEPRFWEDLLAPQITIEGRIRIEEASKYLSQQGCSNTKDVAIIQISSSDEDVNTSKENKDNNLMGGDKNNDNSNVVKDEKLQLEQKKENKEQFDILFEYFHSRKRYGVVGQRYAAVKDMYLVPLTPLDEIPEFVQILEYDEVPEKRDTNILLGVIVIIKSPSSKRKHPNANSSSINNTAAINSTSHPSAKTLSSSTASINTVNNNNNNIPIGTNTSNSAVAASPSSSSNFLQPSAAAGIPKDLLQSLFAHAGIPANNMGNSGVPSSPHTAHLHQQHIPQHPQHQYYQLPPSAIPPQSIAPHSQSTPPQSSQQPQPTQPIMSNLPSSYSTNYQNLTPPPQSGPPPPSSASSATSSTPATASGLYTPGQGTPPPPFHNPYNYYPPVHPSQPPNSNAPPHHGYMPPLNNTGELQPPPSQVPGYPTQQPPPYTMPPPSQHEIRPQWDQPQSVIPSQQQQQHWEHQPPISDNAGIIGGNRQPLPPQQWEMDKNRTSSQWGENRRGHSSKSPPQNEHHRSYKPYNKSSPNRRNAGGSGYRGRRGGGGNNGNTTANDNPRAGWKGNNNRSNNNGQEWDGTNNNEEQLQNTNNPSEQRLNRGGRRRWD